MRRRNNVEIMAEILRIARKGAKKTRLVYGANINFKLLHEYLDELEKAGLIMKNNGTIKTTEKGDQFLNYTNGFKQFGLFAPN